MKKIFLLIPLSIFLSFGFVSCGGDDEGSDNGGGGSTPLTPTTTINPTSVFTNKFPKLIDDSSITRDNNGLVTRISDGKLDVSFKYEGSKVGMICREGAYYASAELEIGSNGFAKNAVIYYDDNEDETYFYGFSYNKDGQLYKIDVSSSDGKDSEITTFTYDDGNLIHTSSYAKDEPGDITSSTIYYSSQTYPSGIENKGCINLFETIFNIDLDYLELAYFAGLLGKSTKDLPLMSYASDGNEMKFIWTFNDEGYPTELSFDPYRYGVINFRW